MNEDKNASYLNNPAKWTCMHARVRMRALLGFHAMNSKHTESNSQKSPIRKVTAVPVQSFFRVG